MACAVFSVHANNDVEALYTKLLKKPDVRTADELISILYKNGEADSAKFHFKDDDDPILKMQVALSMSYYYYDKGDYSKTIEMCRTALKYADEERFPTEVADCYLQMASCFSIQTAYQTSNEMNMAAVRYADKSGRKDRLSMAYYNLAFTHLSLLNLKSAWKYINKSIEAEKELGNPVNLSMRYGLAAEILRKEKKFDEALKQTQKAIELAEEANDGYQMASHRVQAVDIYFAQDKFLEAEKEARKALLFFEKSSPCLETIICYRQNGQIESALGRANQAFSFFKKAEEFCHQLNNNHQLVIIYEALADLLIKTNPKQALTYMKKHDVLKDSIFSEETNRMVSDAEVKYETSQKELKIQEQQNELKTRQVWITGIGSAAVVIILLIIVYVSISNSRKNKRHAAQLKVERDEATLARDEATKARDAAERANALKGVFIDNVVHELRTPINAIQGFSQLLDPSFGSSPEETQEYLGIINDNCNNLITLVQDTIDVSEMENESYPVHPAEVRIETVCKDAADKEQHRLQDKEVKIHVRETGDFCVTTDKSLLTRLLQNLISNACKYTSKGSISIEFHRGLWSERQGFNLEEMLQRARSLEEESGPAKPWNLDNNDDEDISTEAIWAEAISEEEAESQAASAFSITVTDTGCGIAPENAEKIFNRFEKLGSYIPGNGMGLTIVRLIAHLLQGEAYLDTSYEGKGCRFIAEMRCF